ncbi:primosomal protein N [Desulfovibrio sp. X2]|uniref:replication restart helicase PriA n=1 Tax=Desulfovibrio sp. X2 TaxID=941449 RepID=UPI00035878D3|nr:primosomal protein N' [Desulfovibrio sp. X2]EPR42770.1 primosomal protein N [Desulfovibrio sp. X2]
MPDAPRFLRVALPSPPFALLTYELPEYFPAEAFVPGSRALAPLGGGFRAVVVVGPEEAAPEGVATRPLLWPLEREPLLGADYLEMARNLSARLAEPLGQVLFGLLPRGVRSAQVRYKVRGGKGRKRSFSPRDLADLPGAELAALAGEWMRGRMEVAGKPERDICVRLLADPPWPVRPGAVRQARILDYLYDSGPVAREHLTAAMGPGHEPSLQVLEERGLLAVGPWPEDAVPAPENGAGGASWLDEIEPTGEQAAALDEMLAAMDAGFSSGKGASRLLHGITGSGKTFVYLRLIRRCLEQGRPALLLAPEVALAMALHRAACTALPGARVDFYHGYLPPGRREAVFRAASEEGPRLVVGTRSALFLPLRAPGLVVLDEEHDESFKQDERLVYQAKEVAWFRATRAGALLVLGSATPDLKTYHAAQNGAMPLSRLSRRVGAGEPPAVELVDISGRRGEGPLCAEAVEKLTATVEAGEQAIIMLNRRGYSPVMYCLSCEEAISCPNCRVSLTYHKARERLVCHYCGLSLPFPSPCSKCGQTAFVPMGEGTEQLEEVLGHILPPDTAVVRLDRDAARRRERMEAILGDFAAGRAQVMVGTQMLSKGHHFPGVTLVVVAEADMGLNMPDYRATERTFQLLVQVAGRAGRGEKPGTVLIQTRSPSHPFWRFVLDADYEGFYAREIELRRRFGYPPFVRLGLLRLSHPSDDPEGPTQIAALAGELSRLAAEKGVRLLGPAPAPLSQLKGRKRVHCLLKADSWLQIRELYARARTLLPKNTEIRLSLDLDPVSML